MNVLYWRKSAVTVPLQFSIHFYSVCPYLVTMETYMTDTAGKTNPKYTHWNTSVQMMPFPITITLGSFSLQWVLSHQLYVNVCLIKKGFSYSKVSHKRSWYWHHISQRPLSLTAMYFSEVPLTLIIYVKQTKYLLCKNISGRIHKTWMVVTSEREFWEKTGRTYFYSPF